MKKVCVILSTYNGEKYLKEQINSILNQKEVKIYIIVRDDGSTDQTLNILNSYSRERLGVIIGDNIGYANSFLIAMNNAEKADYYAFADQDDVWLPDKLARAIAKMEESNSNLYASSVTVVDENLRYVREKKINNYVYSVGSILSRNRLAGCTMVFDQAIFEILKKNLASIIANNKINYGHDGWILLLSKIYGKRMIVDKASRILYRRHSTTVTNTNAGLRKRIENETKSFINKENKRVYIASYLLGEINVCDAEDHETLQLVATYKKNIKSKIHLIFSRKIHTGLCAIDVKNIIAIIANMY